MLAVSGGDGLRAACAGALSRLQHRGAKALRAAGRSGAQEGWMLQPWASPGSALACGSCRWRGGD